MKRIFTLLSLVLFAMAAYQSQAQTVYASKASGLWSDVATWETYTTFAQAQAGSVGSGTAATSIPSGTHFVYIRAGHTINMNASNRGCKSIYIAATGKLWNNGSGSDSRLQVGAGGTGFSYPLVDTVWVDGVMGGPSDPMFIESGVNAQQIKMFGSGTVDIKRIRMVGGSGASGGGVLGFDINIDVNLWQTANYALTAVYNPQATDNYTVTIFPGKTVTIKSADGRFHNDQADNDYGNYSYIIRGTLDASAGVTGNSVNMIAPCATSPAPHSSTITLKIDGGILKAGTNFKADTNATLPSTGLLDFQIINGGVLDATATTSLNIGKTADNAGGFKDLVFQVDASSSIKRTVVASSAKFPMGFGGSNNTALLLNQGLSDVYTTFLKGTIDNAPPNANQVVNRQWTINKTVPVGTLTQVGLTWLTADQAPGFNPASNVNILRWTGAAYEAHPAIVTGSGTIADPYVATASDFTSFSPFIVANLAVAPVTFTGISANFNDGVVKVLWSNEAEENTQRYDIERSLDGREFNVIGAVNATSARNYSFQDFSPVNGINYYRVRAIDKDGRITLSTVIRVNTGKAGKQLAITPNPVENGVLNLQMSNFAAGNYTLNLFNSTGQKVYGTVIQIESSVLSRSFKLPATVKAGIYSLQVTNGAVNEKTFISVR